MLFRIFTVLTVVALGVSTWILSSPGRRASPRDTVAIAELPGYYLKGAVLTDYDEAGMPSIRLEADRIDQIDHGTEVSLRNVRVNYQTRSGQIWILVGDSGRVEPGGKIIDVKDNVRLQGESTDRGPPPVVYTDELHYNIPEAIASTDDDVRIEYGPKVLTAQGLIVNLKERTMRLKSKVNGRFQR